MESNDNFSGTCRQLAVALLVVFLFACGISSYSLFQSRQQARLAAEKTVGNLAYSLENFLRMHFSVADRILQQASARYGNPAIGADFSASLTELQQLLPTASGVRASDEFGNVVYGEGLPSSAPLSIAGRKFFDEAKASGGLVFGLPLKSRISGKWVLPMARPLKKNDGSFGGVVYINTDIDRIADVFRSISVGSAGTLGLFDADRRIYLRIPDPQGMSDEEGVRFNSPQTIEALAQGKTEAVYESVSSVDGVLRTVGFRKVDSYPLYVLVALSNEEYLGEWRSEVRNHAVFLFILGLTSAFLFVALVRSHRIRERVLEQILVKDAQLEKTVEALSFSEARFRTLTEGLPQMSWVKDRFGQTQYLSRQWSDFTGRPMAELIQGEGWISSVHPEDRLAIAQAWEIALATGTAYHSQARIRRHDGVWRTFENNALAQRDAAGDIVAWVGSNFDISDRIEAQLKLRAAKEAADAANLAKSSFVASMSHEIRTPMNAIIGLTHLLRRKADKPEQIDKLAKIAGAGEHLLAIINDILDLSKIEAGKMNLVDQDVDIRSLATDVAAMLADVAQAKGLRLESEIDDFPAVLRGDRTRLKQALLNLANNAVKFTAAGSVIVRVRKEDESVERVKLRFEIIDTGIGIAPDKLGKLFLPFQQASETTAAEFGGTGLGLAITRRLAELMGGEAGAESAIGQGSTFWFTAWLGKSGQLAMATEPPASGEQPAMLAANFSGARVLLVEDDLINQEVAKDILDEAGLVVDIANDGLEAIDRMRNTSYAVILMDVQMPNLGGLEATRQIRQLALGGEVPIIAMTANAFSDDREQCLAAGMNDFVTKPVAPDALYSTLMKWLS